MRLQLTSSKRDDLRKSVTKKLRREGGIPATVYSRGEESQSIVIPADDFTQILRTPGGRLSLIDLKVDGKGSKAHPVMIRDIQRDPISLTVLHVDLHRVSMNEPVQASVPVTLVGDAPGLKEGGNLEQITSEISVRALPDKIPTHIDVDISHLELGQSVQISEVQVPEDVEILGPAPDALVASVRLPAIHVEEVAPEAEEVEAPAEETPEAAAEEAASEEA